MTLKEHYDDAKTWQRRCVVICFYHNGMCLKKRKWSVRKTAIYFGLSAGKISEDIRLGLYLDKVKHLKSREEALVFIRTLTK